MPPDLDAHQLRPDHHPTPFSAAQIRDAWKVGREVRSLTRRAGAEPVVHVRRNLTADADGGEYEVWTESPEGERLTEPERGPATWIELQQHASMPIETTTIEPVEIDVPMGQFEGLRYTRVTGDAVDTFWFALARPGAPVRIESRVSGEVVFSSIAIEERLP